MLVDVTTLITTAFTTLGVRVLTVLGASLALALGYLLFRWGWRKIVISCQEDYNNGSTNRFKKYIAYNGYF